MRMILLGAEAGFIKMHRTHITMLTLDLVSLPTADQYSPLSVSGEDASNYGIVSLLRKSKISSNTLWAKKKKKK